MSNETDTVTKLATIRLVLSNKPGVYNNVHFLIINQKLRIFTSGFYWLNWGNKWFLGKNKLIYQGWKNSWMSNFSFSPQILRNHLHPPPPPYLLKGWVLFFKKSIYVRSSVDRQTNPVNGIFKKILFIKWISLPHYTIIKTKLKLKLFYLCTFRCFIFAENLVHEEIF